MGSAVARAEGVSVSDLSAEPALLTRPATSPFSPPCSAGASLAAGRSPAALMLMRPDRKTTAAHVLDVWEEHVGTYLDDIVAAVDTAASELAESRAGYILEERLGLHPSTTSPTSTITGTRARTCSSAAPSRSAATARWSRWA